MLLNLETICPTCNGMGRIHLPGSTSVVDCENCHGTGVVPNNDGNAIIEFLNRHWRPTIRSEIVHPGPLRIT